MAYLEVGRGLDSVASHIDLMGKRKEWHGAGNNSIRVDTYVYFTTVGGGDATWIPKKTRLLPKQ